MKTRVVIVGGYLGAGKTTLIATAAMALRRRGLDVGVIVNDQSASLVDTEVMKIHDLAVREVAGGCFCCRFSDLIDEMHALQSLSRVDVILAEPVGSCTDLIATVFRPLKQYCDAEFELAPLTVVVDPQRFDSLQNEAIRYLYRKQLLEGDVIAFNKCDALPAADVSRCKNTLDAAIQGSTIMEVSARTGSGVDAWLDHVLVAPATFAKALELDYDTYAEAEACLGWLNANGSLEKRGNPFSINEWVESVLRNLQALCARDQVDIAHAKIVVGGDGVSAKASVVDNHGDPVWATQASEARQSARYVLNVRAEGPPEVVENIVLSAVRDAADSSGLLLEPTGWRCFSPARPSPAFRILGSFPTLDGSSSSVDVRAFP